MPTTSHLRNLKQALGSCRRALEEFESALLELEETTDENGEASKRSPNGQNLRLLSLPEVCQELEADTASVYRRLRSGQIPSLKLGHALRVRQADLEAYVKGQRRNQAPGAPGEKNGSLGT
jgi:excisionase family DNA binding protein